MLRRTLLATLLALVLCVGAGAEERLTRADFSLKPQPSLLERIAAAEAAAVTPSHPAPTGPGWQWDPDNKVWWRLAPTPPQFHPSRQCPPHG